MLTYTAVYFILFQLWLLPASLEASSLPNVALLGTASQSSTRPFSPASNVIDGNRNPELNAGSCSHTKYGPDHWWSLVLPHMYSITHINITNRISNAGRINGAQILIGNSLQNNGNNNPRCSVITSIPAGGTSTFNCGGMIGRVINVKHYSTNPNVFLTMCELEAYGERVPPCPSFNAVVMGRRVAVVEKKLCWSDALFYCRDFYGDLLSIRSEDEQREVEKVLSSVSFPLTKHVWLGLRRYLMSDPWFWMSGATEQYSHWEKVSFWKNTSPCGAMDSSHAFHWRDLPCEEHLHFICLRGKHPDLDQTNKSNTSVGPFGGIGKCIFNYMSQNS
nr:C-type mannose receptor 2-like [Labrus bergylta]